MLINTITDYKMSCFYRKQWSVMSHCPEAELKLQRAQKDLSTLSTHTTVQHLN